MYARTVQVSLPLFRDQQFSPLAPDSHVGSPFDLNISRLRSRATVPEMYQTIQIALVRFHFGLQ